MSAHFHHRHAAKRNPLYRITLVGQEWHVRRPHASLSHAFMDLDQAEDFVRSDSSEKAIVIEIVAGTAYMVKTLEPAR